MAVLSYDIMSAKFDTETRPRGGLLPSELHRAGPENKKQVDVLTHLSITLLLLITALRL